MPVDKETGRWLTLLKGSPRFVLKDKPDGGAAVLSPKVVPNRDGVYWVYGATVARSGREIESVFRVDTDSGGELYEVYWLIDGLWYDSREPEVVARLGGSEAVFPFDWRYSVQLERDIHHS